MWINALLSVSQTYAPVLRGTANPGCFATGWGGRRAREMQKLARTGDITPKGGRLGAIVRLAWRIPLTTSRAPYGAISATTLGSTAT
jgi:hypothetical protein